MDSICPKCQGTTWIIVDRGSVSGAQPCTCRAEGIAGRLEPQAQIPPLYRNVSIENFNLPERDSIANAGLKAVMGQVAAFARDFPRFQDPDRKGLLLIGDPGTGKTHLAVAAFRRILKKGFPSLFFDYQGLLDKIRSGYDASSNSSDREAYRSVLDIDVLLLDDLGAHRVPDWVEDTITSIITHRCNSGKAVIATTNLPMTETGSSIIGPPRMAGGSLTYKVSLAERIGARACSRLAQMCTVIRMPAVEDYRVRKARIF
jgi:DNA replication protein DnaC